MACPITPYNIVHAGDTLSVLLRGVINPPTTGSHTVSVSTTSDLPSSTGPVTITPAQSVVGLTVTPGSTEAGVTSELVVRIHGFLNRSFRPLHRQRHADPSVGDDVRLLHRRMAHRHDDERGHLQLLRRQWHHGVLLGVLPARFGRR